MLHLKPSVYLRMFSPCWSLLSQLVVDVMYCPRGIRDVLVFCVSLLVNAYESVSLSVRKVREVFTWPWGLWLQCCSHLVNYTIICYSLCGKNKAPLIPLHFQTLEAPWYTWCYSRHTKGTVHLSLGVKSRQGVVCQIRLWWPACGRLVVTGRSAGTVFVPVIGSHVSTKLQPSSFVEPTFDTQSGKRRELHVNTRESNVIVT